MASASFVIPCLHRHFHRPHHNRRGYLFQFHCNILPPITLSRHGGDSLPSAPNFFGTPLCSVFPRSQDEISFLSAGLNIVWDDLNFRFHKMSAVQRNSVTSGDLHNFKQGPDHLLILVHGINASPSDWTYAKAELQRQLGGNFLIYASSCNSYTKTFDGIDRAGKRLADEVVVKVLYTDQVLSVVQNTGSLKKISFLAHSLGGLFSRHAIAILYSSDNLQQDLHDDYVNGKSQSGNSLKPGSIGGLEPINFITLATPHLGVRGNKQLPFLVGLPILEKLAPPLATMLAGRTGHQLFLTDDKPNKPPLLLRMASDCEDFKFISALASFRNRILYANVSYDHMVGWRTSSIRRETEHAKSLQSLDGYKHVVNVENYPPVASEDPQFPSEAAKAKEAAQTASNAQKTTEYYELMEEEMIRGLQRVGWTKVDVSFHSATWPMFAHNYIIVKDERLYNAGASVIAHVADSIKQQESSSFIASSL